MTGNSRAIGSGKITIIQGDITRLHADIIVNAANSSLMGGGGVDGAIHRAGGPAILEECRTIVRRQGGCQTGEAVITTAGQLAARFVIHTVGPVWQGGHREEARLLRCCYENSLKLAEAHEAASIAFPNISTGVYGYPKQEAASIAWQSAVDDLLRGSEKGPKEIIFVCFDRDNADIYEKLMSEQLPS
ncbi:O-acetyl-ADP-ribose deacetylase [Paenibacillus sp. JX-17]|uniref:O-acetyl-ADP-ribose deacetylase n=1 Tax=Paenibacillus lacisoli TaxID=3064525 RepID=A0ABT9C9J7_9BACL|nr:O-acetyl-ADP-ribose deacetylase [Paenibacillus sp. JX-17]MDO7905924.1 O-acetyl-ADP-ribose deacetylase [Paenibacillus sp. JX-17]